MFSRAVGREGHCKYHWRVWGALAVFRPHWVCPRSRRVCFPRLHCSGSRLLCREWALSCVHIPDLNRSGSGSLVLHKGADLVGPAFCAFPGSSSSGDHLLGEHTLFRCIESYHLPDPSHSVSWCTRLWCAVCLFWGADLWL